MGKRKRARGRLEKVRSASYRHGGGGDMAEWWSIEVFDADAQPGRLWKLAYEDALIEAAITNGATYWEWHEHPYGVVFEVLFDTEKQWEAFRNLPAVSAALDNVPDPVNGLLIYRGRGGGAGPRKPRKPKPAPSADAIELPVPVEEQLVKIVRSDPPGHPYQMQSQG
jgi:hypothetical protein